MKMSYLALFLNAFLMILLPIVLASYVEAKRKPGWALFGVGALTFVFSQLGHFPFNWLILRRLQLLPANPSSPFQLASLALFLGLSAGLFEEVARYLAYRRWAKNARTWGRGLMLGAGHGGLEAILLGLILVVNYFVLIRIRSGALLNIVPEGQLPAVEAQITALVTSPWYLTLMGAAERLFALCFHLSASLLVMQVFLRGQHRWLLFSILWHTLFNAVAVFAAATWSVYAAEAIIALLALVSLGIVFRLRSPEPEEPEPDPSPLPQSIRRLEVEVTENALENSRYR